MLNELTLTAYITCAFWVASSVFWRMWREEENDHKSSLHRAEDYHPDTFTIWFFVIVALMLGLAWPAVLFLFLLYKAFTYQRPKPAHSKEETNEEV